MPLSDTGTITIGELFDRFPSTRGALTVRIQPNAAQRLLVLTKDDMRLLELSEHHITTTLEVLERHGYLGLDPSMSIPTRVALRYGSLDQAPVWVIADLALANPTRYPRSRKSLLVGLRSLQYRYDLNPRTFTIGRLTSFTLTQLKRSMLDCELGENATGTHLGRITGDLNNWGIELAPEQ